MKPDAPTPSLHAKNTYSADQAYAALCVMEWLMERWNESNGANATARSHKFRGLFEAYGWQGMRSVALQAGCIVDAAWHYADTHHGGLIADWSFDWEFTPAVCSVIDWDLLCQNNQYADGKWAPAAEAVVASIIAREAMRKKEPA